MNIAKLSYKNMADRPLSTSLSLLLLTLGVGVIALLMQVNRHLQQQMENNIRGINMVVGAKGSPLQLILSAVYHVDSPTGNISLSEAEKLKKNPLVAMGIPLSFGDSYRGYRIVGTDHQYPKLYNATLSEGQLWNNQMEVNVGATVAQNLGLKLGDTFIGAHGLDEDGEEHQEHVYRIIGIFDKANAVIDQLILTATESVWAVHHHEEENPEITADEGEHDHNAPNHAHDKEESEAKHEREITAMLIQFKNPMGMVRLPRMVNETTSMQAAVPVYEIQRLFNLMGVGLDVIQAIALVIIIVSGLSVFISLYSALKDRKYEMALMRTYGATRWQLVWSMLQEGLLLTSLGFLLGMIFSRLGFAIISVMMEASYHYSFSGWSLTEEEWLLMAITLAIGLTASLIPAIGAFRINISKTLANA